MARIYMPRKVEDITPEWLGAALSIRYPGAGVDSLIVEDVIAGMATKVRVRPRYAQGSPTLPETLIVKGHLGAHELGNDFSYEIEMRSYAEIVPDLDVTTPVCFFAGGGYGEPPIIILEDLRARNVKFLEPTDSLDFETADAFLAALARIHAAWWDDPRLEENGITPWLSEEGAVRAEMDAYFQDNAAPSTWNEMAKLPRGAAIPKALRDQPRIERALDRFLAFRRTLPPTLSQGDEHLANLYIEPDGTPGFLDWQSRKEPWCVSFAYFIILALDVLERRAWEKALLTNYLGHLTAAGGPDLNFDQAWRAYRESAIFPYIVWFTIRPVWQPEHYVTACATRAAWAAWDLDIFALGSANNEIR